MRIEWRKPVGPFACNCRVLACPETGDAAIIDPGDEAQRIVEWVRELKTPHGRALSVKWLLHTHGHLDHIGATRGVKTAIPSARIALHGGDEQLYQALQMQGQMFGIQYDAPLPLDQRLEHEQNIQVGKLKLTVVHTPGHSPGSICLRLHEDSALGAPETIYTGDTLFRDSVGRTDLWGADQDLMFQSIRSRILSNADEARVCPGHGADSTIGRERRENPFLT